MLEVTIIFMGMKIQFWVGNDRIELLTGKPPTSGLGKFVIGATVEGVDEFFVDHDLCLILANDPYERILK